MEIYMRTMMKDTKLTSVKILEALYHRFKIYTVNKDMTLQKLTNRCVDLYIHNEDFKDMGESHEELIVSSSRL